LKRTQLILLAVLALIAGLVAVLATRSRQPPFLPQDSEHRGFVDLRGCVECHGPDGALPRGRNHPIGEDCTRCHGMR
jgi:hypothetical protein